MRRQHERLRESVENRQLPGGAQLWVVPRAGRRCQASLSVAFGALWEAGESAGEPDGIAHFLEHRLFDKEEGDISERFIDLGVDVDAQTGYASTAYTIGCGADVFPQAVELLFELAGSAHFAQEDVLRERDIVGHELRLYEDNVEWVAFQTLIAALYPDQRLAVDIAGTPQSLSRIDADLLHDCHRRRYHAGAVQVIAAGPVDVEALARRCRRHLSAWPVSADRSPPPRAVAAPRAAHTDLPLPRRRCQLGFADDGALSGLSLMRRELALELTLDILFGPGSEFFTRTYESGLVDGESFGGEVHMEEGFGFCLLGGDTDDPAALSEAILDELRRALASGWIEEDFERARRRACGDMICRFEDVESTAGFVESAILRGCHPFDVTALYAGPEAVTVDDVWACLRDCLRPERAAVTTVGAASG